MKETLIAVAMGLMAMGGTVAAQEVANPGWAANLMHADANGDEKISRVEFQTQADARFARMDANGDGRLDAGEGPRRRMRGGGDAPPPPTGADAPPPPPPALTRDAFRARELARFDRIDADRDGMIDAAEAKAAGPMRGRPGGRPPAAD